MHYQKNDLLSVQTLEYFPSGSLSSFPGSEEHSIESVSEQDSVHSTHLGQVKVLQYEKQSFISEHHEEPDLHLHDFSKIIQENKALRSQLLEIQQSSSKVSENSGKDKIILNLQKENKGLKEDLIVFGNKINEIEKKFKDLKVLYKNVNEDKSFLLRQIRILARKILDSNEKSCYNEINLLNEKFYVEVLQQVEKLVKDKELHKSNSVVIDSLDRLGQYKSVEDEKISISLQTEPCLDKFGEKYWGFKSTDITGNTEGRKKKVVEERKSFVKMEKSKFWNEDFKARDVLRDLKKFTFK